MSSWEEEEEQEGEKSLLWIVLGVRVCGVCSGYHLVNSWKSLHSGRFPARIRDLSCQ